MTWIHRGKNLLTFFKCQKECSRRGFDIWALQYALVLVKPGQCIVLNECQKPNGENMVVQIIVLGIEIRVFLLVVVGLMQYIENGVLIQTTRFLFCKWRYWKYNFTL